MIAERDQARVYAAVAEPSLRSRFEKSMVDIVDGQVVTVQRVSAAVDAAWLHLLYSRTDLPVSVY